MSLRVTRCPKCNSTFNTNAQIRAVASGLVRCGACLFVFKAEEHFTDVVDELEDNEGPEQVFLSEETDFFNPAHFLHRKELSATEEDSTQGHGGTNEEPGLAEQAVSSGNDKSEDSVDPIIEAVVQEAPGEHDDLTPPPLSPVESAASGEALDSALSPTDQPFIGSTGDPHTTDDERRLAGDSGTAWQGNPFEESRSNSAEGPALPLDKGQDDDWEEAGEAIFVAEIGEALDSAPPEDEGEEILIVVDDIIEDSFPTEETSFAFQVIDSEDGERLGDAGEISTPSEASDERLGERADETITADPGDAVAASQLEDDADATEGFPFVFKGEEEAVRESPAVDLGDDALSAIDVSDEHIAAADEEAVHFQPMAGSGAGEAHQDSAQGSERDSPGAIVEVDEEAVRLEPLQGAELAPGDFHSDPAEESGDGSPGAIVGVDEEAVRLEPILSAEPAPGDPQLEALPDSGGRAEFAADPIATVDADAVHLEPIIADHPAAPGQISAAAHEPGFSETAKPKPDLDSWDEESALEELSTQQLAALNTVGEAVRIAQGQRSHGKRNLLIGLTVFFGIGLVLALLMWQRMPSLSQSNQFRPYYVALCAVVGCQLPPFSNVGEIRSESLQVSSHPEIEGALLFTVVFRNRAKFPQPFPLLNLSFTDLNQRPMAQRDFGPAEYLPENLRHMELMPVNTPIQITLELVDPGDEAINYNIAFSPPS